MFRYQGDLCYAAAVPLRSLPRLPTAGRSTCLRVLDAVRAYFRAHGTSPSHSEIAIVAGIATKRVQHYVQDLGEKGYLRFTPRTARSIELVDRAAMLSDAELRAACVGRGWTVTESKLPQLAEQYPVEPGVANWGLKLLGDLDDIG